MKNFTLQIVLIIAVLVSCQPSPKKNTKNNEVPVSKEVLVDSVVTVDRVLSLEYEIIEPERKSECLDWIHPDSSNLIEIIHKLKPKNSMAINEYYDYTPCRLIGELIYSGDTFTYYLNAGGYIELINNDTTIHFGCEIDCGCEEFFLGREFTAEEFEKMMN